MTSTSAIHLPHSDKISASLPRPHHKTEKLDDKDPLVKQTRNWVSQTFYGTMLKQMREDPFRSELFDGGRGGQAFGSMYDQKLAEHMARGHADKLVHGIVHKMMASGAYKKQAKAKMKTPLSHQLLKPAGDSVFAKGAIW